MLPITNELVFKSDGLMDVIAANRVALPQPIYQFP